MNKIIIFNKKLKVIIKNIIKKHIAKFASNNVTTRVVRTFYSESLSLVIEGCLGDVELEFQLSIFCLSSLPLEHKRMLVDREGLRVGRFFYRIEFDLN